MAATVRGVFEIMDRATPKMKTMEQQALKTDAAIASLGATLDTIGSQKQLKNIDNLERRLKTAGKTVDETATKVDNATKTIDRHTKAVQKTDSIWMRFKGTLGMFGRDLMRLRMPAMFLGMGTAIGVAGQAVGALSGGVVGLASELGRLSAPAAAGIAGIAGLATAAITGKMAMSTFTGALAGNQKAIRSLGPEGRRLMGTFRAFQPVLRQFKETAGQGIFGGMRSALVDIRKAAPTINTILSRMSRAEGGLIRQASRRFIASPGARRDLLSITGQGTQLVQQGGTAAMNIVDALRHVAVAAQPFTKWLGNVVLGWSRFIDKSAEAGRSTGRLATWFDRAKTTLTQLGHTILNVWKGLQSLMKAARPLGDALFRDMERGTKAWATMLGTQREQTSLTQKFLSMEPAIKSLFRALGLLGSLIFNMGANNKLAGTITNLSKALPPLANGLSTLANTLGPPLAKALAQIAGFLNTITQGSGPFVVIVKSIGSLAGFLDKIARNVPALKQLFTVLFSTAIISRYAIKLGLLEAGWWKVWRAASAAGAAGAAAGGVGAAGAGAGAAAAAGGSAVGEAEAVGVGAILGSRGRRIGGLFRRILGRGGPAAAAEAAPLSAVQQSIVEGVPGIRSVSTAAKVAEGGGIASRLAGGAGMLAKIPGLGLLAKAMKIPGVGLLGKVALPITIMQGLFGALTAGRSGSFGHQAAQTAYGGVNAATGGLLGGGLGLLGLHNILETPGQRSQRNISSLDRRVQQEMAGTQRIPGLAARLHAQLRILDAAAGDITDRQQQASKDYIKSLQDQTTAIQQQIVAMRQQQQAAGRAKGQTYLQGLDAATNARVKQVGPVKAFQEAAVKGIQHMTAVGQALGTGPAANAQRLKVAQGLLKGEYRGVQQDPRLKGAYQWASQAILGQLRAGDPSTNYQISGGRVLTGTTREAAGLAGVLGNNQVQIDMAKRSRGLTAMEKALAASLVASGNYTQAQANAVVRSLDKGGPAAFIAFGRNYRALKKRASGGRLGGHGLSDTVPVPGGTAAPGELVVNRHTEQRVNSLLGNRSLGGMVAGENKKHGDAFATGGRQAPYQYSYPLGRHGSLIGTPYAGTHGKQFNINGGSDNWESENAVDIGTPVGTPVLAVMGGTIGSQIGSLGSGGRFAGLRLHLQTPNNEFYYAHLSKLGVSAGMHVKPGAILGLSGEANGVAHLHFASRSGNPERLLGMPVTKGSSPGGAQGGGGPSAAGSGAGAATLLNIQDPSLVTDLYSQTSALTGLPGFSLLPGAAVTIPGSGGGGKGANTGKTASGGPVTVTGGKGGMGFDNFSRTPPIGHGPRVIPSGGPRSWLTTALHLRGLFNPGNLSALYTQMLSESSGDPSVVNEKDSNWQAGHPSKGLLQTIDSTFLSYALPGHKNIWNPIDNAAAAAGYMMSRYGHIVGTGHGYARGGRMPAFAGWHGQGMAGTFSQPTLVGVGERGKEHVTVTPDGKGGPGATINATFNINGGEAGAVQREVEQALKAFVRHLDNAGMPG